MKVKSESKVAQSCLTLSHPMGYSLPGSLVHGIFQARVLEWVAIASLKETKPCNNMLYNNKLTHLGSYISKTQILYGNKNQVT